MIPEEVGTDMSMTLFLDSRKRICHDGILCFGYSEMAYPDERKIMCPDISGTLCPDVMGIICCGPDINETACPNVREVPCPVQSAMPLADAFKHQCPDVS